MSPISNAPERLPRRTGGLWTVVTVLLLVGIVVPLLVFLYAVEDPTLWGFPFYYWFQFAMIPVVSALTYTAFRLSLVAERRERTHLGLPADPAAPEDHPGEQPGGRR